MNADAAFWRTLHLLAGQVRGNSGAAGACSLLIGDSPQVSMGSLPPPDGEGWKVSIVLDASEVAAAAAPSPGETRYLVEQLITVRRLTDGDLPAWAAALLETYLPYCLAPLHARRMQRPFTVSHFAQSLDGRIATGAGDSKWIGCEENRVHAHRMRALCDAILIGANTLRTDRPALTVRHTEGADPARIVVGVSGDDDVDCLEQAGRSPILLFGSGRSNGSNGSVETVAIAGENGRIRTSEILRELYRRDILSVYIEGGATTTSTFLAEGNIDVLQLHISPMIIGSGINSFTAAPIRSVADSLRFESHTYRPIGDGILFVGQVSK